MAVDIDDDDVALRELVFADVVVVVDVVGGMGEECSW